MGALSGVDPADPLPPAEGGADALAAAVCAAVALGVALRLPLALGSPDAEVEPVVLALPPLAVFDGVLPTARDALDKPLLLPLEDATRGKLSVGSAEGAPEAVGLSWVEPEPPAEHDTLTIALAEPLSQEEVVVLGMPLGELLEQGLPTPHPPADSERDRVAARLTAALALPAAVALLRRLDNAVEETGAEPVAPDCEPPAKALAVPARGDCESVSVAGNDPRGNEEGVPVGRKALLSAPLLLAPKVIAALPVVAGLAETRALAVAASSGVELREALRRAVAEMELVAVPLALLLPEELSE